MYWPLGAPRVYAAARPRQKPARTNGTSNSEGEAEVKDATELLGLRVSRSGRLFATITAKTLTIWQSSPTAVLASVTRSPQSLIKYGSNVSVLLRPDASIAAVQTLHGFLVTYTVTTDPDAWVYQLLHPPGHARRQSNADRLGSKADQRGLQEVNIRFRMVIKVDAGIGKALALDDELVVATEKPAAVQCIRWTPDNTGSQTSTELLSRMTWIQKKATVVGMVYDKAMSLAIWTTNDGRAYAVQRVFGLPREPDAPRRLFRGYGFHIPDHADNWATQAAINARFSLLAIACANSEIWVYTARDYVGSIPLSHKLQSPASQSTTGRVTSISYSPDGYCLFAGYERGWALWSVYGKPGASSFTANPNVSESNKEGWLSRIHEGTWLNGGLNILLTSQNDDRLWLLDMAKSAVTGCFSAANVSRTMLLTNTSVMVYRGYDLPVLETISADASLWHHIPIPATYLGNQRPIRSAVISPDGRYIAIAGRRGLAHHSVTSGRWKTFAEVETENAFVVRGGMCWYQHILIAAVETDESHELRLYSRELGLDESSLVYIERLPSPVVVISLTGQDSLLVYTYENILYHYVINATSAAVTLVPVGQIALNGIVRAPARVRAVSWILPDHQLRDGDPSQDVKYASVIFLVDAKLVLLQSSTNADGALKYDMRVIANNVEYFDLMRDQVSLPGTPNSSRQDSPSMESQEEGLYTDRGLKDSLWFFDGNDVQCWMDVEDLIQSASTENDRDLPQPVSISTDFYPSSIILDKGILLGIDADLVQRRDVQFAFFRFAIRTQLFLPQIIRRHLSFFDSAAASSLAHQYQQLPYFSHALEVLLHTVLDDEVDALPSPEDALLPSVLSFLSSFQDYLDILVQCTRKTEVRSWRTLFSYLPPPQELFEASLRKGLLKTAGGYLLVLHTFDELESSSEQCVRLLQMAMKAADWDLCKELARFLMALDQSGDMLRQAMQRLDIGVPFGQSKFKDTFDDNVRLKTPRPHKRPKGRSVNGAATGSRSPSSNGSRSPTSTTTISEEPPGSDDYFSPQGQ